MSTTLTYIRVTSTTHPEGDLQEYTNAEDAVLYASELVEGGFSPEVRIYREGAWYTTSYDNLIRLAAE